MRTGRSIVGAAIVCLLLPLAGAVRAEPVYWAVWEKPGEDPDTVIGKITVPGLPEPVTVTYAGAYDFAYATGTGTTHWVPESTYTGGVLDNGPPRRGIIGLRDSSFEGVHALLFSQWVESPVLAITGLGEVNRTAYYEFEEPFEVLAHGSRVFEEQPDNILRGKGGSGTILFDDTDEIDWCVSGSEGSRWNGFTVGILGVGDEPSLPGAVPAPGAVLLVGIGTGLVGYLRRRRAW